MFFRDPHFDLRICAHVFHPIGFVPAAARKEVDCAPDYSKPDLDLVRLPCDASRGGEVAIGFVREVGEGIGVHGGGIIPNAR